MSRGARCSKASVCNAAAAAAPARTSRINAHGSGRCIPQDPYCLATWPAVLRERVKNARRVEQCCESKQSPGIPTARADARGPHAAHALGCVLIAYLRRCRPRFKRSATVQVRSLGRGGGKGPLRRAPEEVYAAKRPPGVIRSPLVPEEVQGLHKSGNLTQMLPAEAALMAVGWPRQSAAERDGHSTHSAQRSTAGAVVDEEVTSESDVEERGSHPARLLFMARLAEKSLMSYERAGVLRAACCGDVRCHVLKTGLLCHWGTIRPGCRRPAGMCSGILSWLL